MDQLGVRVNPTVVKVVKVNDKQDVEKAIALLKARKRDGHVSNAAGFFVEALKQNWGSEVASNEDSPLQVVSRIYLGKAIRHILAIAL
ncbi:MAG: hypothetical protein AB4038_17615 [Prochloraceae cyanobacterium]